MIDTSRIDMWIKHEGHRVKLMKELEAASLTRHEIVKKIGLSDDIVGNLIRQLNSSGYIKKIKGDPCTITGRPLGRYTVTDVKYVPKDWTNRKERYEANKAAREHRAANKPAPKKETKETVIKVNEYTTIYLNSQRPQKDYAMKKEKKSRRNSSVAIGSGMDLFGSW